MTTEIDLPCSDCGTDLDEETIPTHGVRPTSSTAEPVTVATCPACGVRYYPTEALSKLSGTSGSDSTDRGGFE